MFAAHKDASVRQPGHRSVHGLPGRACARRVRGEIRRRAADLNRTGSVLVGLAPRLPGNVVDAIQMGHQAQPKALSNVEIARAPPASR